ncbi:Holliday junction resolvase RuvX [Melghirimyces algeriensis]|uniref:Putative pre-16S rRNA nuclease n=1 Tax=Melghirimyces algeriensis TaxID=910412 RepID=A0A521CUW1_9BACL|nr:Holliday junction resolvase RuvX [Melghirimyces algeriensis]SMO63237.1 putative holliday junction resolvase [Melghirimyces algeriensis]
MKRIMGLDVGEKRVGVAVSDPMGWTAQGIEIIQRDGRQEWLDQLAKLIEQYEVETLVVGFPRNMDGSIGEKGEACQELSRLLEKQFKIPVELWDERLSTVAVERTLIDADMSRQKRRKVIDQMAASWILQGYLDAQGRK